MRRMLIFLAALPTLFISGGLSFGYDYRPACQWIRFQGEIEFEKGESAKGPILLNVNYQLDGQPNPGVLLVGYPLQGKKYFFVLAPFRETIERAVFLKFKVPFDQDIRFSYSAATRDSRFRSDTKETQYKAERSKVDGEVRCGTDLRFEKLTLKKHETPDRL